MGDTFHKIYKAINTLMVYKVLAACLTTQNVLSKSAISRRYFDCNQTKHFGDSIRSWIVKPR